MNGAIQSVVLQPDGKVLVGGDYYFQRGTNWIYGITRRNANGSLDGSFKPGVGTGDPWGGAVRSLALQPDGNVLIGGSFTTVKGMVRPYVARLYGDSVAPSLSIARSNAYVIVSWPVTGLNFQLLESPDLSSPDSWSAVMQTAVTNSGQLSVDIPTAVGSKFFRLKSQ